MKEQIEKLESQLKELKKVYEYEQRAKYEAKERYLLIEWVNGNPIIDGCKHFDNRDDCLQYHNKLPEIEGVEYTICRTNTPYK